MSEDQQSKRGGYGNPPPERQFQPGVSGNPKGRPRGSRNMANEIDLILSGRVDVTKNGRRERSTRRKVIAEKLVVRAMRDDHKAIETVLKLEGHAQLQAAVGAPSGGQSITRETSLAEDEAILAAFIARSQEAS